MGRRPKFRELDERTSAIRRRSSESGPAAFHHLLPLMSALALEVCDEFERGCGYLSCFELCQFNSRLIVRPGKG